MDINTLVTGFSEIKQVVAWDDTTTANVIYLKYLDGRIDKVNTSDKTILTATSGVWADRATLTYTEGGE